MEMQGPYIAENVAFAFSFSLCIFILCVSVPWDSFMKNRLENSDTPAVHNNQKERKHSKCQYW